MARKDFKTNGLVTDGITTNTVTADSVTVGAAGETLTLSGKSVTTVTTEDATTIHSFDKSVTPFGVFHVGIAQGDSMVLETVSVVSGELGTNFSEHSVVEYGDTPIDATISVAGEPPVNGSWVTTTVAPFPYDANFSNTDSRINAAGYGNGLWLIGGYYNGRIASSTDTVTWVTQTSNFGATVIGAINYGNSLWVAVGYDADPRTSTDGVTWVTQTGNFWSVGQYLMRGVAYNGGKWVAVGKYGVVRTSTDAVTWVSQVLDPGGNNEGDYQITCWDLAYGNGLWMTGGYYGDVFVSTDAVSWTRRADVLSGTWSAHLFSFDYGNGTWAAGGYYGKMMISTDTITWVTATTNITPGGPPNWDYNRFNKIRFGAGGWVAVGYYGHIRISNDATTWSTSTNPYHTTGIDWEDGLFCLAYGGGKWVAGGYYGTLPAADAGNPNIVLLSATVANASQSSASVSVMPQLF